MTRALRYLWDLYIRVILASIGVFAALSLVLGQLVRIEFFNMYYEMLPMMLIIFMVIFSFNLTILYRNMALSFNCRRKDFFWGSQAGFVLTALGSNAIVWLAGALPGLLGAEYAFQDESFFFGAPAFTQPPMALAMLAVTVLLQPVGAAAGCLYEKHKAASTVFMIVCMLLSIVGTVVLMFLRDGNIPFLPAVAGGMLAVLAALAAVCEVYFWRSNLKAIVR